MVAETSTESALVCSLLTELREPTEIMRLTYISDEYMDVLADGVWEKTFKVKAGSVHKGRTKSMA